jgi:hypothetical protein
LSENDKALLETTSACQKQQTLVGNDKRLSETTKLSRQIYPYLRKAFVEMYHEPTCLVEKKDKHMLVGLCRFFVVLIYKIGT